MLDMAKTLALKEVFRPTCLAAKNCSKEVGSAYYKRLETKVQQIYRDIIATNSH